MKTFIDLNRNDWAEMIEQDRFYILLPEIVLTKCSRDAKNLLKNLFKTLLDNLQQVVMIPFCFESPSQNDLDDHFSEEDRERRERLKVR